MNNNIDNLERLIGEVIFAHADKNSPEYNECDIDICAWCSESKQNILELKAHVEQLENTQAGVDDIMVRIRNMSPIEFKSILEDALTRLGEYDMRMSDDINAFQRLKTATAMLLTWDSYWDKIKALNT